jgi:hypothetical protein
VREDTWYKGGKDQEGSDGSVMGCREDGRGRMGDGRMGCAGMQNEEISKETVGEWGITYHIHGHRSLGAMREE